MIYHIYANRSNVGDWVSAKGIQKLLHPLPITELLCDTPFVEETIDVLSKAAENDLVVIGGGGLFMNYFEPFWRAFASVADKIPFVIWGAGCCDLKNETTLPSSLLMEKIVKKSRLCIVRDAVTRNFLSNCNLPEPIACPAVNYIEPFAQHGNGVLHVNNYTTAGAAAYESMRSAAEEFAEANGIMFRETNNRIERDSEKAMAHVLLHYEKSKIVLSSALHGCIIGVAMGLKVLAVSGDRKIEGFMNAVGLQDWVLNVDELPLVRSRLLELKNQPWPAAAFAEIQNQNRSVAKKVATLYYSLKDCIMETDSHPTG